MPKIICKGAQNKGFGAGAITTGMQIGGKKMARYIDADELEELFREVIGGIAKRPEIMNGNLEHMVRASAMVIEMIKDAPTADVVEVVRCKDCKYLVRGEGVCRVLSNNYEPPVYVEDDDFCSRGERRDDAKSN